MSRRKLTITSITTLFACGVILGVFGLSSWFGRGGAGFSSSLLPEWKYRRPITLSGQTSNLTDYQVKVELPASLTSALVSDGKLQSVASNFADIRFTDANDNQLLNFWIETATTTATSTIWVKVPGLSASKSSTIYMYYGNPSASSASSGTNTFVFFDDFLGSSIDTAKWTGNTEVATVSGSVMSISQSANSNIVIKSISLFPTNSIMESRLNFGTFCGSGACNFVGFGNGAQGTSCPTCWWYDVLGIYVRNGASVLISDNHGTGSGEVSTNANTVYTTYRITRPSVTPVNFYKDNVEMTGSPWSPSQYYTGNSAVQFAQGATLSVDWVFVRKYASPEPTATVGSEQTQMTPVAHWRFDEGTGAIAYNAAKKVAETNKWTKRRALSISNTGSTAQTNYQTKVELTTSNFDYSQTKTDGSDIRFVASDGTELNFWKETWNTSATSTFWVKVPSLPGNTTSTIYMYYGNPSASSASNGSATFEFFDDFLTDQLGSYWLGDTSHFSVSGGELISDGSPAQYAVYHQINIDDNYIAEYRGSVGSQLWVGIGTGTSLVTGTNIFSVLFGSGGLDDYLNLHKRIDDAQTNYYEADTGLELTNTYHDIKMVKDGTYGGIYIDETEKWTGTVIATMNTNVILNCYSTAGKYDIIKGRKYASPEPSVTAVGSQEFGAGSKWSPDAAWISGAQWTTGKFNSGLKFDGIDDYVNFGDINF